MGTHMSENERIAGEIWLEWRHGESPIDMVHKLAAALREAEVRGAQKALDWVSDRARDVPQGWLHSKRSRRIAQQGVLNYIRQIAHAVDPAVIVAEMEREP